MSQPPRILFIDLGSQYSCVLERKLKALHLEVVKYSFDRNVSLPEEYFFSSFEAVVLSGSPSSVNEEEIETSEGFKSLKNELLNSKETPILGICFGMQLLHHFFGGRVERVNSLFGEGVVTLEREHPLFLNIPAKVKVWGSFSECVTKLGHGFYSLASREKRSMISSHVTRPICTIQFHPELYETEFGEQFFRNFFTNVAKLKIVFSDDIDILNPAQDLFEELEKKYKRSLENSKVLIALSGGIDSSVLIHFLREILPENDLYPVFISTSLTVKRNEARMIRYFRDRFSNFQVIDWGQSIFEELKGVTSPEEKRRIISLKFRSSFDELLNSLKAEGITHFAQGTVYSDQIESGSLSSESSKIKSHHNIAMFSGEKVFPYKILEPFSHLFKDQVKALGARLNLPSFLLSQQPFPGPGLAIRIIGEVTQEKVELLSSIHEFIEEEFQEQRLIRYCDQYFPILLSEDSVGVKGDQRVYGKVISLRAVKTTDFMSAKVSQLPLNELVSLANKIIAKFKEVNRVLYDLTTKPAGTIEWE